MFQHSSRLAYSERGFWLMDEASAKVFKSSFQRPKLCALKLLRDV